jgi:hypothetical protein
MKNEKNVYVFTFADSFYLYLLHLFCAITYVLPLTRDKMLYKIPTLWNNCSKGSEFNLYINHVNKTDFYFKKYKIKWVSSPLTGL